MPQALIIDDDKFSAEIIATLLEDASFESISVTNPLHLTEVLSDARDVRVIFLDLEIPRYDGFEVYRDLRADTRLAGVPVIAYTVHISEVERVRRAGFDGFLGKPLKSERFPEQLQQILSGKPVWEAL